MTIEDAHMRGFLTAAEYRRPRGGTDALTRPAWSRLEGPPRRARAVPARSPACGSASRRAGSTSSKGASPLATSTSEFPLANPRPGRGSRGPAAGTWHGAPGGDSGPSKRFPAASRGRGRSSRRTTTSTRRGRRSRRPRQRCPVSLAFNSSKRSWDFSRAFLEYSFLGGGLGLGAPKPARSFVCRLVGNGCCSAVTVVSARSALYILFGTAAMA